MDTCRPLSDIETGNPDLSLLSYLECLEKCFLDYSGKVSSVDFQDTFNFLVFHTPFPGLVKGGHRKMTRKFKKLNNADIEADFQKRVSPSIEYCMEVGNIYSATVYLALCSLIDNGVYNGPSRMGIFSYGSGCSSEFFSGIITPLSKKKL